jgi:transcriptional repressor NrdR
VQLRDLVVVKKNGERVMFDRDKLARSIYIAVRKRPISSERVEKIVNSIQRRLESTGEVEIMSTKIGDMIMESLARLDTVAYVRYASVYKDFREVKDFEEFLDTLAKMAKPKGDEENG